MSARRYSTLILLMGCGGASPDAREAAPARAEMEKSVAADEAGWGGGAPSPEEPPPAPGLAANEEQAKGGLGRADDLSKKEDDGKAKDRDQDGEQEEGGAVQTRAWFPESFLWMPLVETDPSGRASVTVPVPDTLTTWRLLALAQSAGAEIGAVTGAACP